MKRQRYAAAYGAGQLKQAQIAGEYPPPPVDAPNMPVNASADDKSTVSGTVTGRFSSTKPNFTERYRMGPVTLPTEADLVLRDLDYSKLEERIGAWFAHSKKD